MQADIISTEHLTQGLNPAQKEAVISPLGHTLVLAGAGSGKTRVLVHRIAYCVEHYQTSPYSILSVTFTNKAAQEMQSRVSKLLNQSTHGMWVGTFHGLCHRFLRQHWQVANLPEGFQILDSDDQKRIIKRIHKDFNLDEQQWPAKKSQSFINQAKEKAKRAKHMEAANNPHTQTLLKVYTAYEEACHRGALVDFSELILRSYEVLRDNEELRTHYQNRFEHILVDEFQDTNHIQYAWLKLLMGASTSLMAVGDDDQSIYSWRGARIENMMNFNKDYPNAHVIRLEQNYRSTATILQASNAIIEHNGNRLGKKLWTDGDAGDPIELFAGFNEVDEARFVVDQIRAWKQLGGQYDEIAILYRSNAQSRTLEEQLTQAGVPYRVYGGLRFFERAEIKDALAYLRLIANNNDDAAFERVVNTPTRGIGQATLSQLRECAREQQISLWQSARTLCANNTFSARAHNALERFMELIETLQSNTQGLALKEQTEQAIQNSGLLAHYQKDQTEKGRAKVENLDELITATELFHMEEQPEGDLPQTPLQAFLSQVSLDSSDSNGDEQQHAVQLMTLHAAKGLEFPMVMLTGMEDGLFPHAMSIQEPGRMEEERRLCYVGMTRAMKKLFLTYAECRRIHGSENYRKASRFLDEIPEECLQEVRLKTKIKRPLSSGFPRNRHSTPRYAAPQAKSSIEPFADSGSSWRVGTSVSHPKFGQGIILQVEGSGPDARLQIQFQRFGAKWLIASYITV